MIPLPLSHRTCGECTACCTAYPILPGPNFFSEGKPAATPCKHLCARGCSIYEQRPKICRDFRCDYLEGSLGSNAEDWRPDRCGIIIVGQQPLHNLFQGEVPRHLAPDALGTSLCEVWPHALVALDANKVRYRLHKVKYRQEFITVYPYGLDLFGFQTDLEKRAMCVIGNLGVWWITEAEKEYSREVAAWWEKR